MNSLQLITETWPRDIWGLIDYEADDLIQLDLNLEKNGFIYRHFNRIIFSENEINEENYEKLFQILKNENSEYVLNFNKVEYDETDNISSINHAWFLLRPQKMENKISKYRKWRNIKNIRKKRKIKIYFNMFISRRKPKK